MHETLAITDRAYILHEGNVLRTGTAQELADDEFVRKVYLGKNFELRKSTSADNGASSTPSSSSTNPMP